MQSIDFFQRKRKIISWILAFTLIIIILFSESYWEEVFIFSDIFFLAGAILVGFATIGRLWCSLYISGYKTDTLITIGPYSICRNPLYFFSFLGAIGVGLAVESLLIPFIVFVCFLLYYSFVIREEEKKLYKIHGKNFQNYCKKTPKFFPSFSLLNEPEKYTVMPKIYKKSLFDALWFIWLIGIIEIIEALHEWRVIPIFFRLP
jgi:protein-S-isoprenylcysteine O-methyltransferase Ste14